jgi:hypothetical protein
VEIGQGRDRADNRVEVETHRCDDQPGADKPSRRLWKVAQQGLGAGPRGDHVAAGAKTELKEVDWDQRRA